MTLVDVRQCVPERPIQTDLCIAGAGAAGITLAREFLGTRCRVTLLEGGGLQYSRRVQQLYAGEHVGQPSYALAYSRFRVFGGSTARWAAQCRPLDAIDFQVRPGFARSGWPFDRRHIEAWEPRAMAVCRIPTEETRCTWMCDGASLPIADDELDAILFRFGYPRDFGQAYRPDFERASNVDVLLHANLVAIRPALDLRSIQAMQVKTVDGRSFEVRSKVYVLACGGIENARLLLASNQVAPAGIGNGYDLVGRFFMDHPYMTTGHYVPASPTYAAGAHVIHSFKNAGLDQTSHVGFALNERVRREEEVTGCSAYFIRSLASEAAPEHFSRGGKSRQRLAEFLAHRALPGADIGHHLWHMARGSRDVALTLSRRMLELVRPRHVLAFRTVLETMPRADSRVTLTSTRDRLGVPRARVDWRIDAGDRRGLDRLRQAVARAIATKGLGVLIETEGVDDHGWPVSMEGGKHHMGTTRMHVEAKLGVVDPDCRVHGIENLYVAGSSVFPTSGYANPTLTIVTLALRLGDHLKSRLGVA
jgi:choline dehydrogenase-like flavoprotein